MILDQSPSKAELHQFASQLQDVLKADLDTLNECFMGHQSDEFTLGLLTGFSNAFQILKTLGPQQAEKYYEMIISYIADHLCQRESFEYNEECEEM
ncbi:hypothetical protein LCGC14_2984310 [marine sediment metagenome]|uniref:Uncharacterized protein n=1 Tax=marine sediment metagenome TaxID=412755 RepID=A0A0F8ZWV6_9ZZZZ